jgi:nucleoside-diphosphate-sugar epimerase
MVRKVLVTGGSGFIGRRVIQRFLERGWATSSFSLPGEPPPPGWTDRVTRHEGDIAQATDVHRAAEGVDLIIHLAAIVGLAGEYDRQWRIIAGGTRNVCVAAVANKARVVVTSSIAVYGSLIQTQTCRESDGFGPWQGAYGRAKQGQETITRDYAARTGLKTTIIRPANVYGLGGASAWGDRFIEMIRETGGFVIGDAERNNAGLVHVENLADAIVLAATSENAIGKTYNVCDGERVTWRQYTDDLARLAGKPPPPAYPLEPLLAAAMANENPANLIPPRDPNLPTLEGLNLVGFDNRFDASLIRKDLDWHPSLTYADAIRAMAEEFR